MRKHSWMGVIVAAVAFSGCRSGVLMKKESETHCPTDIRQTVPWCAGEDAIFMCPCRPGCDFYGHKPTCWRAWPTSGAEWRDAYCCGMHEGGVCLAPGAGFYVPPPPLGGGEVIGPGGLGVGVPAPETLPPSTPEAAPRQPAGPAPLFDPSSSASPGPTGPNPFRRLAER